MILAEMWRKKMEAMKERERTRTMKGSLKRHSLEQPVTRGLNAHTRSPGESSV